MIKKIFFVLCSLLLCGFKEPHYCKLSDRIFNLYNKELRQQKGLYLNGSGGAFMDDIKKINSSYKSYEPMTIELARQLYVEVIEGYLNRYNEDEKIRPYLHNYPFTIDNLNVMISFWDKAKKRRDKGLVALIYIGKNQEIVYSTYDYEKKDFVKLHRETYSTAREIVLGSPQECP